MHGKSTLMTDSSTHTADPPQVSFQAGSGISLSAAYRTSIYVMNNTLGVPLIVQLDAELSVTGV